MNIEYHGPGIWVRRLQWVHSLDSRFIVRLVSQIGVTRSLRLALQPGRHVAHGIISHSSMSLRSIPCLECLVELPTNRRQSRSQKGQCIQTNSRCDIRMHSLLTYRAVTSCRAWACTACYFCKSNFGYLDLEGSLIDLESSPHLICREFIETEIKACCDVFKLQHCLSMCVHAPHETSSWLGRWRRLWITSVFSIGNDSLHYDVIGVTNGTQFFPPIIDWARTLKSNAEQRWLALESLSGD